VYSFVIVHGGADGTNQLAGRVLAMHAWHRLMIEMRIIDPVGLIRIDSDPMHLAPERDLLFSDHRDVVLRLAGNRARAASDACAKIDDHSPCIPAVLVFVGIVECLIASWFFCWTRNSLGIGEEFRECAGA